MAEPRILAVTSTKGGAGKTSCAVNAAACLAGPRRRVLLIDLDPAAAATYHLQDRPPEATAADALEGAPVASCTVATEAPGLELLPGDARLTTWDRRPERLPVALARLAERIPAGYAAVFVDLPPGAGVLVRGALAVLPARILAPVSIGGLDLLGLADLLRLVDELREQNPALELAGIIPNRIPPRARIGAEILEALQAAHGRRVLPGIRQSVTVAEAALARRPLVLYAPRAPVTGDFQRLTKRLDSL